MILMHIMGSEQSTVHPPAPVSPLKSQRDEDIPYTSYSISKPIDASEPMKLSPRLQKHKSVNKDQQLTPKHEIIVVADGAVSQKGLDPELVRLASIPRFQPIIRSSLNSTGSGSSRDTVDLLDKLDHRQVLQLCLRYQDHLRQLSEAVAFDQNALCIRIKEVDCKVQVLMNAMTERQKKYAKYAEQFQKVGETSATLNRIKMTMEQIHPIMDRLNQVLPPEEQLEPFNLKVKPKT